MAAQLPRGIKIEKIRRGNKRLDAWLEKRRQVEREFQARMEQASLKAKDVYVRRSLNDALEEIEILTGMIHKALKFLDEKEKLGGKTDNPTPDKI